MYDLIGDIHGHYSKLCELLTKLGYSEENGSFSHPTRKAIFVGDYVDRGPEIRETLHPVRNMTRSGAAIALMGNHEYNAMAYHYPLGDDKWLRSHNAKHHKQHEATLSQFEGKEKEWGSFLEWFYELPLFLDLGDIRVVHACWDQEYIDWMIEKGYRTMTPALLEKSHERSSKEYKIIDALLKGKEIPIPEEFAWPDKDGHMRTENRIKWWVDTSVGACGDFLFDCPPTMISHPVPLDVEFEVYDKNAAPVFFGHYWLKDEPQVLAPNVVCLDYSVAKGGSLVAYRWEKGVAIGEEGFVWV